MAQRRRLVVIALHKLGIVMKESMNAHTTGCEQEPRAVAATAEPSAYDPTLPRLLRFNVVHTRTGLSRSTIRRLENCGGFPKRIRISVNIVAWLECEIVEWIRDKVERGSR